MGFNSGFKGLTMSEPTGSYEQYLSDKIMFYADRRIEQCIHTI